MDFDVPKGRKLLLAGLSETVGIMSEIGKLLVIAAAAFFMVSALAAPAWLTARMRDLDLRLDSVNFGVVKVVSLQAPKASAQNIQAAEALTRAEVALSEAVPAARSAAILKNIQEAKQALDAQSESLVAVAGAAGLQPQVPPTAWVYVGYFNETGKLARPGDRIDPTSLVYEGDELRSLVLRNDAVVSSNGDDCTKTAIENVPAFDPSMLSRKFVVLAGSRDPLHVIRTARCSAAGRGKTVFAEVQIPKARARFAELGAIGR